MQCTFCECRDFNELIRNGDMKQYNFNGREDFVQKLASLPLSPR